jgi:hypothetical protein
LVEALRYIPKGCDFDSRSVIVIFYLLNTFDDIMALDLAQYLTEMNIWDYLLRVKAVGAEGWQPGHLHVPTVEKFWEPQPPLAI